MWHKLKVEFKELMSLEFIIFPLIDFTPDLLNITLNSLFDNLFIICTRV